MPTTAHEMMLPHEGPAPDMTSGSVLFIGTATVLIRYGGFTVLTDPNFLHKHDRARLGYSLRAKRLTDPAIGIRDLPPLDAIVLSHYHGDHFDRIVEREFNRSLLIVTTPHAAGALRQRGFIAPHALTAWSEVSLVKRDTRLRITATPARHAAGLAATLLPPVMGSVLDFQSAGGDTLVRMYITGDTLPIDELREIPRRFSGIDLALIHLGGTRVLGNMVTMDGAQGVKALQMVEPRVAIPVHYNDYNIFKSPLSDFQRRVEEAGLADRVRYLAHGDTYTFNVSPSRIVAAGMGVPVTAGRR